MQPQTHCVEQMKSLDLKLKQRPDTTWMLDSDATHHITSNPDLASGIHPMYQALMIDATGKSHPVVEKEKVFIQLSNEQIKCIDNILYVLGIHRNLLSVGCIANQDYT